ncbi:MAG: hypothetical protein ACI4ET_06620 [Bilifractor sp.]
MISYITCPFTANQFQLVRQRVDYLLIGVIIVLLSFAGLESALGVDFRKYFEVNTFLRPFYIGISFFMPLMLLIWSVFIYSYFYQIRRGIIDASDKEFYVKALLILAMECFMFCENSWTFFYMTLVQVFVAFYTARRLRIRAFHKEFSVFLLLFMVLGLVCFGDGLRNQYLGLESFVGKPMAKPITVLYIATELLFIGGVYWLLSSELYPDAHRNQPIYVGIGAFLIVETAASSPFVQWHAMPFAYYAELIINVAALTLLFFYKKEELYIRQTVMTGAYEPQGDIELMPLYMEDLWVTEHPENVPSPYEGTVVYKLTGLEDEDESWDNGEYLIETNCGAKCRGYVEFDSYFDPADHSDNYFAIVWLDKHQTYGILKACIDEDGSVSWKDPDLLEIQEFLNQYGQDYLVKNCLILQELP